MLVRKLTADDDVSAFKSSNYQLTGWLRKYGHANQLVYGVTWIAVDGDAVVGYVTVSSSSIYGSKIPGAQGGPSIWPTLLIARMATVEHLRRTGIGKVLMRKVFELAKAMHNSTGCWGITVDAKPDAVSYYQRYMFEPMVLAEPSDQIAMYLEIGTVLAAITAGTKETPADTCL